MSHFIHRFDRLEETIVALATPAGNGGVAIIRLSGPQSRTIAQKMFSGDIFSYKTHTAHLGTITALDGRFIDQGLCLYFQKGRSYTGEETVEFQCHGGSLIAKEIIKTAIEAGAKMAAPGEFTCRAFLNGMIDLSQAEAVQELISAKNTQALAAAQQHLEGTLSQRIRAFQQQLTEVAAILEAWVDFPEEGLEFASQEELIAILEHTKKEMLHLSTTFHEGRMVREGIRLCLVGVPNVGKSSLMNALLQKERAIVTPIAGTTRDLIEEELRIGELHFSLTDTAGLRETQELIEREGIERSKKAIEEADLILLVLDATRPQESLDLPLLSLLPAHKTIALWNKIDLTATVPPISFNHTVQLSAKEKIGIDLLKEKISSVIWEKGPPDGGELILTQERHFEALNEAILAVEQVIEHLHAHLSPELVSSEMRAALYALGTVIGTNVSEEILTAIFSKFCVGK